MFCCILHICIGRDCTQPQPNRNSRLTAIGEIKYERIVKINLSCKMLQISLLMRDWLVTTGENAVCAPTTQLLHVYW